MGHPNMCAKGLSGRRLLLSVLPQLRPNVDRYRGVVEIKNSARAGDFCIIMR